MAAGDRRVVVGCDGSEASAAALRWAAEHALPRRWRLEVVHAAPLWLYDARDPDHRERRVAPELVDAAARLVQAEYPSLEVTTHVDVSPTARLLLHRAEGAVALVVGAHGRGGFPGMHLGSVGAQVAAHAPCPVVVVRDPAGRGVVVGVDGSEASAPAVGFAFEEAAAQDEPLTAVHAWLPAYAAMGDVPFYDQVRPPDDELAALLSEGIAGWREKFPEVEVRQVVRSLHPVAALVEASTDARLVAVGSRGRGGFTGLLLGSVSRSVLQHARCSVAVVRP